ncbi:MAG: patatin-like phospholipase family protein [Phycisphaerales bacterium]|nr:patatin-like phospholipase family protein [Phycisphaerales bacterium]MCB9857255.1 patatin-like phospholipase family protein [Phycisphaerales bacterium]MCB9863031.1 patatin-like phospholipase family protein [Phycisphaerales bacterium]
MLYRADPSQDARPIVSDAATASLRWRWRESIVKDSRSKRSIDRRLAKIVIGLLLTLNAGCLFPETVNTRLLTHEPALEYRFENVAPGPDNTDATFICLTLSGGGTRAAALAYGVMEGLRDMPAPDGSGSMLDEVDIISSVSGGSFAAMGYGVWRDDFFEGKFRKRFLDLNLPIEILRVMLNPINALRLPSVVLDRTDVAAEYYDKRIFEGYRYADLIQRDRRPFIVINSTNISTSTRVEFTQGDFDLLGSDLGSVPVGWAVAASSAFPVVFSPLRMKYFEPAYNMTTINDHVMQAKGAKVETRLQKWARQIATPGPSGPNGRYTLDHRHHKYLFLADGGLVDNLGLRHVIDSMQGGEIRQLVDAGRVSRLIVITVDAGVETDLKIEERPTSPGIFMQTIQAASIGVDNYSDSLVRIMDHLMYEEPRMHQAAVDAVRETCPEAVDGFRRDRPNVERRFVHIGFHQIKDRDRRERFERIPTRLFLPQQDVDDLIALGRELVKEGMAE